MRIKKVSVPKPKAIAKAPHPPKARQVHTPRSTQIGKTTMAEILKKVL